LIIIRGFGIMVNREASLPIPSHMPNPPTMIRLPGQAKPRDIRENQPNIARSTLPVVQSNQPDALFDQSALM
jgi:hypothetical protein